MKTKEFYEGFIEALLIEFEEVEGKFVKDKNFKYYIEILKNQVKINWEYLTYVEDRDAETGDCESHTKSSWEVFDAKNLSKIYFSFWEVCKEAYNHEVKNINEAVAEYQEYLEENLRIDD